MHCGIPSLRYTCCMLFVHWEISAKILALLAISAELLDQQPTNNSIVCCKCAHQRVLEQLFLTKCVKNQCCRSSRVALHLYYKSRSKRETMCSMPNTAKNIWPNSNSWFYTPHEPGGRRVFLPLGIQSSSWVKQTAKSLLCGVLSSPELLSVIWHARRFV